jgi:hypothetical protein
VHQVRPWRSSGPERGGWVLAAEQLARLGRGCGGRGATGALPDNVGPNPWRRPSKARSTTFFRGRAWQPSEAPQDAKESGPGHARGVWSWGFVVSQGRRARRFCWEGSTGPFRRRLVNRTWPLAAGGDAKGGRAACRAAGELGTSPEVAAPGLALARAPGTERSSPLFVLCQGACWREGPPRGSPPVRPCRRQCREVRASRSGPRPSSRTRSSCRRSCGRR